ncbi:hypothetical protein NE236_25350 [Actinoallomurus purpureus]|uniref:hypothetical protein n=1 Tax=Actinoallomurus purpureus TaxID=478114 RepID=UPI0020929AF7|nr:hypothetical protein [Actinoallomurus purpureus]MCO6008308.1 hypothetical protein [Actinoallomurus purpureus]
MADWHAIWPFFTRSSRRVRPFPYPLDLNEEKGRDMWLVPAPGRTVLAVDDTGIVLRTANVYANRSGNGAASYTINGINRVPGKIRDWPACPVV